MNKYEIRFLIEKEYNEFLLNLQNNYKDKAKEHFDVFVDAVEDAKEKKIISKRQYKKYNHYVDVYQRWFDGDEEALLKAVKPKLYPELTFGNFVFSIVAFFCISIVIIFFVLILA